MTDHALRPNTTIVIAESVWGTIRKRLWDARSDPNDLEEAVRADGKGFHRKDDWYNGINDAFMLDERAAESSGDDAIADAVGARRTRERVVEMVETELAGERTDHDGRPVDPAGHFWLSATLVEAYTGLGRASEAAALEAEAETSAPESWMVETLNGQLAALERLHASADGA
jgi:hypothetical protein